MKYIPAKTIISTNKSPSSWFGNDFNMNIYKGCSHSCIYCDSRSDCYRVENFDEVRAKENALAIINRELRAKTRTGVIGTGAMSDPYNPFEAEHKLTRNALELINAYGFGVAIATKSDLITRDLDILKDIKEHSPVIIKITITTFEDILCRMIEQDVVATSNRLKAIEKISQNGLFCGVLLMPILPFINDSIENITQIVNSAASAGAKFIYPAFGVTLRQNQREHFYQQLDANFPKLRDKYQTTFGDSYQCQSPNSKELKQEFSKLCAKHKLLYKMPHIITAYKGQPKFEQMTLF